MSKKRVPPRKPPANSVCGFELWDKRTKSMRACGKKAAVRIDIGNDDGTLQAFCKDHYVDAVMQMRGRDEGYEVPRDVEKLLIGET